MCVVLLKEPFEFDSLVEEKIEHFVAAAELRAAAAGNDLTIARKHARIQANAFVKSNNFIALGIDALALLAPSVEVNAGALSNPPKVVVTEDSSLASLDTVSTEQWEGDSQEIGKKLMDRVIDLICQKSESKASTEVF